MLLSYRPNYHSHSKLIVTQSETKLRHRNPGCETVITHLYHTRSKPNATYVVTQRTLCNVDFICLHFVIVVIFYFDEVVCGMRS